jgi:hypothetical protein
MPWPIEMILSVLRRLRWSRQASTGTCRWRYRQCKRALSKKVVTTPGFVFGNRFRLAVTARVVPRVKSPLPSLDQAVPLTTAEIKTILALAQNLVI